MILLAGFLDVVFRGFVFLGLALGVGGLVFRFTVLWVPSGAKDSMHDLQEIRIASLMAVGAFAAGIFQLLGLVFTYWTLVDGPAQGLMGEILATGFARAGIFRAALALILGCTALALRRHPRSSRIWNLAAFQGAVLMVCGAWLVHGYSRLEHRTLLMSLTVLHQFVAVSWVGGVVHLLVQWRLLRRASKGEELWTRLPGRFSSVAMTCVAVLLAAGLYLYWQYIHGMGGLIGTAYGTMLLTKITLMLCALGLGGANFLMIRSARRARKLGVRGERYKWLPAFMETEVGIGIIILMTAAAMTGQPPAVDIPPANRSQPSEVLHVFAAKKPQLSPVSFAALNAAAAPIWDFYSRPTVLDKSESDFIHNISGIFVILIGLLALLRAVSQAKWLVHWPLAFVPFASFLLLFAQPTGWPFGDRTFFESLALPETLEHRIGTLIPAALGIFEWRVQKGTLTTPRLRYLFPLLCGVGGALLLSHSHSIFSDKPTFLIEASHNALGVLAVLVGAGRWLQLQTSGRPARLAGILWPISFMMLGWVLVTYQEV